MGGSGSGGGTLDPELPPRRRVELLFWAREVVNPEACPTYLTYTNRFNTYDLSLHTLSTMYSYSLMYLVYGL